MKGKMKKRGKKVGREGENVEKKIGERGFLIEMKRRKKRQRRSEKKERNRR